MPNYRYECKICKKEFSGFRRIVDRHDVKCPFCKGEVQILIVGTKAHFFREGFWREMSYSGVPITSKRQLKQECNKRGQISPYYDIYPRSLDHAEETARKAEEKGGEGNNH